MTFRKEREEVAYFMRRLYTQGLTTTSGGNISMRVGDKVVITPSQIDKGRLQEDQIGIVTLEGENLTPELPLSMETGMHLAIYKKRPDVRAVVHAHPVTASSFAVSKTSPIMTELAGETWALVGKPEFAPYEIMGSPELAEVVSETTLKSDAVLMENHGVLAVGNSLINAFNKLELMEAAAKTTLITKLIGNQEPLEADKLKALDLLMGR